ncbi:ornithine cyclodeaminase family protein [Streptomyces sp. NPDC056501]|uniref:ornithine cyclodeaminase family protein n=1 Tax=Streptomyces sp. NPDC056501 TaxID=3345841 RepID=UPI0036A321CB
MLILTRSQVAAALDRIDPVAVLEEALVLHVDGRARVPGDGHVGWTNSAGAACRSLVKLGALEGEGEPRYGLKVINASLSNVQSGRARAGGLVMLFDQETARPTVLADAALISAVRTTAYTVSSIRHLGPLAPHTLAVIGCGNLARHHLAMLPAAFPTLAGVRLFDRHPERARNMPSPLPVTVAATPAEAVRDADVVVCVTNATEPYLRAEDLTPGTFVAHVSLYDLDPQTFATADAIYVDDLPQVCRYPRQSLGRFLTEKHPGMPLLDAAHSEVTSTLGHVLTGSLPATRPGGSTVISHPDGLGILDIALLNTLLPVARAQGAVTEFDLGM